MKKAEKKREERGEGRPEVFLWHVSSGGLTETNISD